MNNKLNHNNEKEKSLTVRLAQIFRGTRSTEYSLMIAIIGIIVLTGITWLGIELHDLFTTINETVPQH